MSQVTLRISTEQNEVSYAITLEGRVAGPWVAELNRTWSEIAPSVGRRRVLVDLRNTTYADSSGIRVLRQIVSQASAEVITSTPWTKYLAEEITRGSAIENEEEL
jgi:anti-anti-sigma regulatory factor